MKEVRCAAGYTDQDFCYRQDTVGAIQINTLYYAHQQDTYGLAIRVYRQPPGPYVDGQGFGDVVFEGTLAELITRLEVEHDKE